MPRAADTGCSQGVSEPFEGENVRSAAPMKSNPRCLTTGPLREQQGTACKSGAALEDVVTIKMADPEKINLESICTVRPLP